MSDLNLIGNHLTAGDDLEQIKIVARSLEGQLTCTLSICRFLRLVCDQDMPEGLLPEHL